MLELRECVPFEEVEGDVAVAIRMEDDDESEEERIDVFIDEE